VLTLTLNRYITANGAVIGTLEGLSKPLYTLEDAWLNNVPRESCIPTGDYVCKPHGWQVGNPNGHKYTQVWEVTDVRGRSAILIHAGNYTKDTLGCILVGLGHKDLNKDGYLDVVHSKDAMAQLLAACPNGFDLEIVNC